MVQSKQKSYLKLGQVVNKNNNSLVNDVELYMIQEGQEKLIYKGDINSLLMDNYHSQEYFDYDLLNENTSMYLLICEKENDCEKLDLTLKKDSQNNKLFNKKKDDMTFSTSIYTKDDIPDYVQKNFTYFKEDNAYIKESKNVKEFYFELSEFYGVIITNSKENTEEKYLYDMNSSDFSYIKLNLKNNKIIDEIYITNPQNEDIYQFFYDNYFKYILDKNKE